jgi:hypothetical protein
VVECVTVDAVAFDFGGVLTHSAFDGVAAYGRTLGLPDHALVRYFRADLLRVRAVVLTVPLRARATAR